MKTYQESYFYRGANPGIKELASKMLVRGFGTRDIAYVLSISRNCVSNLIASYASINLKPGKEHYNQVQVDGTIQLCSNQAEKSLDFICLLCRNQRNISCNNGKSK